MSGGTREDALAFILRKTVADAIKAEADGDRPAQLEALRALHAEHGVKAITVTLPDGEKVATLTLTEPKPVETVDEDALLAWAREHRPDLVRTVEHPAVAAWSEDVVDLEALRREGLERAADGVVVTADGEPVSGVTHKTPPIRSFSVRYEGGSAGAARVIDAWRRGELATVDPGETLPAIGAAPDVDDAEVLDEAPADPWAVVPEDLDPSVKN